MSFVSRFLVWIGRLYTGFNLGLESGSNYYSADNTVVLKNGDNDNSSNRSFQARNKYKRPNKQTNKINSQPKKVFKDINPKQVNPVPVGHPISVSFHWPVFTICVSLLQWAAFQLGTMYANNGWFSPDNFEANHLKRHEIWRQFTSLFVHDGGLHLLTSILEQMISGCCLEVVHGWKPVLLLYFGGALIADFGDLIEGTGIYGCGASGAISALYAGHLAAVILNWKEISGAIFRTILLLISLFSVVTGPYWYPIFVDVLGPDIEFLFGAVFDDNVSHAAHIGGVVGGFCFGICVLKKFRERAWKIRLIKIFRCIAILLVIVVVGSMFLNPLFYWKELQRKKSNGMKFNKFNNEL